MGVASNTKVLVNYDSVDGKVLPMVKLAGELRANDKLYKSNAVEIVVSIPIDDKSSFVQLHDSEVVVDEWTPIRFATTQLGECPAPWSFARNFADPEILNPIPDTPILNFVLTTEPNSHPTFGFYGVNGRVMETLPLGHVPKTLKPARSKFYQQNLPKSDPIISCQKSIFRSSTSRIILSLHMLDPYCSNP